ncbi:hypothetical protein [Nostoc sp.]|uniref:hypothetical protein n=1 Tax=Nostoc sp. TaxID=1180 RepID=UPI002FFC1E87
MSEFLNLWSIDVKQGIREAVEKIAAEPGTKVFYLDGKKINSKETFLSKAAFCSISLYPNFFVFDINMNDDSINSPLFFPANI